MGIENFMNIDKCYVFISEILPHISDLKKKRKFTVFNIVQKFLRFKISNTLISSF